MKKAIEAAIALLKRAEKDWVERAKASADDKTKAKAKNARDKARKEILKAIGILEMALKKNSGDGQDDKNP